MLEIFQKNGVAINGYDVVAFHTQNLAVKGTSSYSHHWGGVDWYFKDEQHLNLFQQDPEKYIPQFGGYCAFGASEGYLAAPKPQALTIQDGKLYLNLAKYVRNRLKEKMDEKIEKANQHWPSIKSSNPITAKPIPIWWKYQFLKLVGKDLFS